MEWKTVKLGEICNISIGRTPPRKEHEWFNQTTPSYKWVSIKDMGDCGKFIFETSETISEKGQIHFKIPIVAPNTILLSFKLTVGRIAITGDSPMLTNEAIAQLPINDESIVNKDYLFYYLKSFNYNSLGSTSSIANAVNSKMIRDIDISLPPLETQRRIAAILSSLDDKIENNNRINRNLEAQAQALFKSWFGEETKTVKLNEVSLNVTDGVHNTVIDDKEGEYLLLSCKNIVGGQLTINSNERRINRETFEKLRKRTKLAKGDILISTVGTVGEVVMLHDDLANIEFQRSVGLVKPDKAKISSAYMYSALRFKQNALKNIAHGAVQQCIFIGDLKDFEIPYSSVEKMRQYENIVTSIFDQIYTNISESQRLAALRDTLLPKLMKGEIAV